MFSGQYTYILCLMLAVCLSACTPYAVREAQAVVAEADSLWQNGQMYGMDAGDSATLAETYETLKKHSVFSIHLSDFSSQLSDTYAHACYHYGRLLRKKDNPVEAMQAFINATHTRTRDYHILGRVYSNMGSICHLASEYDLSYDMYEKSAEMFLRNGDTINYYYALNDMAFELADQGKKEETISLLLQIENYCTDEGVLLKTIETKAEACLYVGQYDSVLYYTYLLCSQRNIPSNIILLRAKSFSFLGQKDSAVHYANHILSISNEIFNKNSALYILTHNDDSKGKQDILMTATERSDVQKLIEIYQRKLACAIQLLEQDIKRTPNLLWLYSNIITLVIVGTIIIVYVQYKRRKKILLSQQIENLMIQNKKAKTLHEAHHNEIVMDVEQLCATFQHEQDLYKFLHWNNFSEMCELSNRYFYNIITKLQPYKLSQKEIRLCILILLKSDTQQMVNMIPYSHSGLGKFKYTTARKFGTTTQYLRVFLLGLLG